MRVKYLCLLDEEVYEIPSSKVKNGKFLKEELAGRTAMMMEMTYETENRRPFKINRVVFERAAFDEHGIYDSNHPANLKKFCIKLKYLYFALYDCSEPLPIPSAPVVPTEKELAIFKAYLYRKYPALLKNSPAAIEDWIAKSLEIHKKEIEMLKASHRKKKKA